MVWALDAIRQRLNQVLALLRATSLPSDLVDDPAHTAEWLATVNTLRQALRLLWVPPAVKPPEKPRLDPAALLAGGQPPAEIGESRADRVVGRFNRMIEGLPVTCLRGMSPVSKLGLLQPLLHDLETGRQRWTAVLAMPEMLPLNGLLYQYGLALAAMAARHVAPDPPMRAAESVPAGE
ncbi:MAG TPA: hypothetical protein VF194_17895 [Ferrovibrio sp.]|jgi:hypothetical protein|uniref:hypothetical protein n=1 Tax=Ferrovibrio sp. TaxID=1917215 RepID=UPI002ECFCB70